MSNSSLGWIIFIASVGSMCTLLAVDVSRLTSWDAARSPAFVGLFLAHLGAVISAFVGGKLIPPDRAVNSRDRITDVTLKKEVGDK